MAKNTKKPAAQRKTKPKPKKPARAKRARRSYTATQKTVFLLAGVLVLAVVAAAALSAPDFKDQLFALVGIFPKAEVPQLQEGQAFGPVSVHFIDVGQGDAILVEADGEFALIDAGPPEGEENLVAYLRAAGVETLRYVVMTHPHADHIGGMQAVVERFGVSLVLLPDLAKAPYPTNALFLGLLEAMTARGVPAETGRAGGVYPLGAGALTVLYDGLATEDNLNLISLMILFEGGGLRFLATGDAEVQNERQLLESAADVRAQIFSAAHHGSSTSNSAAFIAAVRPSLVVIGSAQNNSYGHPHVAPLEAYAAVGATVLNTAHHQNVRAGLDLEGNLCYAVSAPQALPAAA